MDQEEMDSDPSFNNNDEDVADEVVVEGARDDDEESVGEDGGGGAEENDEGGAGEGDEGGAEDRIKNGARDDDEGGAEDRVEEAARDDDEQVATDGPLDKDMPRVSLSSIALQPEEPGRPKSRLVIHKLMLINFKSYAGRQEIGPFHKVGNSFSRVLSPATWLICL